MPEHGTVRTGLITAEHVQVPLDGVSIDAEISRFCARVTVTQRYVNREAKPIEAVYVFPLDEGAAVCGFQALIDGTLVIGEVKEREDAFKEYDEALERGDGAFLLDEERPDVFQASVGNLLPGKEVLLKLTYVRELAVEGKGLRFSMPTTVSPRYAPATDQRGVGRPDAQTLNPPLEWEVPYGLDLSVRLAMGGAISRIESPSHCVGVSMSGQTAEVRLSQRQTALDRDFILAVECAGLDTPHAFVERDDAGSHAVAVAFAPQFAHESTPCDVTFLIDRSGSMEGTSIEEVRNALQLCLRSMIAGCTFNIVGFGSTFESLFPASRSYDEGSLAEASAHVRNLRANLGGTEILPALQMVLAQPRSGSLLRQIVVLTDGQVTNTDAVLALVKQRAADARVFTFGIGAGSSHHLVNGLARAGGGTAEFIHPGERIEPKVVRQFGRLLSPALTDVRMSWGGLDARQAPSIMPPVFAGDRLVLYALVRARNVDRATLRLSATSPTGPLVFDVVFDPSTVTAGTTVATLAARARIRELEESPEWAGARGSRQQDRKAAGVSREIVELAKKYSLISRETSFVAVERRTTPVVGEIALRRIPIALTSGWGGVSRLVGASAHWQVASAPMQHMSRLTVDAVDLHPTAETVRLWDMARRTTGSTLDKFTRFTGGLGAGQPDEGHTLSQLRRHRQTPTGLSALVNLQRANGSWDLTEDLARAIGHDLTKLEAALSGAIGSPQDVRRALATALALLWLNENAADREGEWQFLARKAEAWLSDVMARPATHDSWLAAAAQFRMQAAPPRG
jgi:Ca-activated chloride channel family protein